jgi:hypothetical protein
MHGKLKKARFALGLLLSVVLAIVGEQLAHADWHYQMEWRVLILPFIFAMAYALAFVVSRGWHAGRPKE